MVSHILKSTKKWWKKLSNSHVGDLNIHSIVACNYVEHLLTPPSVLHNSIHKCNTSSSETRQKHWTKTTSKKTLLKCCYFQFCPTPSTRQFLLNISISAALLALTVTALTGPSCSRVLCLDSSTIDHSWFDIIYIDLVGVWLVTEETKQKEGQGLIVAYHFLFGFWKYGPEHLKTQISFSMCLPEPAIWLLWAHCLKLYFKNIDNEKNYNNSWMPFTRLQNLLKKHKSGQVGILFTIPGMRV